MTLRTKEGQLPDGTAERDYHPPEGGQRPDDHPVVRRAQKPLGNREIRTGRRGRAEKGGVEISSFEIKPTNAKKTLTL